MSTNLHSVRAETGLDYVAGTCAAEASADVANAQTKAGNSAFATEANAINQRIIEEHEADSAEAHRFTRINGANNSRRLASSSLVGSALQHGGDAVAGYDTFPWQER